MKALFTRGKKEYVQATREGFDIVIFLGNRLFGAVISVTNKTAKTAIYESYKWKEAILGETSKFYIPLLTKNEFVDFLRKLFPGLLILEYASGRRRKIL